MSTDVETFEMQQQAVERLRDSHSQIETELSKVIVGQKEVTSQLLISLFAGGHCLITGAPGLAKTLLVRSLAQMFHLKFHRIQFTPDLMPADITGTEILEETTPGHRELQFVKGPIFANVILADEINRTPPKTQAALLEAMQEHQVTAGGVRYPLEEPFFVLATQNPIEMEGTYPLPEAQLDRFMFNVLIDYLPEDDEVAVVMQTTAASRNRSNRCSPATTCASSRTSSAKYRSPRTWSATPCNWPRPAGRGKRSRQSSSTSGSAGELACGRPNSWCWGPRPARCWPAGRTSPWTTSASWYRPRSGIASWSATGPRPKGSQSTTSSASYWTPLSRRWWKLPDHRAMALASRSPDDYCNCGPD